MKETLYAGLRMLVDFWNALSGTLYDGWLLIKIYPGRAFWCLFIFCMAVITRNISETCEKEEPERPRHTIYERQKKPLALKCGFFKVASQISTTLLVATVSAVFLSYFIKPSAEDAMPALFWNAPQELADMEVDEMSCEDAMELIETLRFENEDEKYYSLGYIYFHSGNYDLALEQMHRAYKEQKKWYYAYDIGGLYAYQGNYTRTLDWFTKALKLSPPYTDRSNIIRQSRMIENYLFSWFSELVKNVV